MNIREIMLKSKIPHIATFLVEKFVFLAKKSTDRDSP